ncbi:YtxH domain-containing protein [Mariniflexile sp.]|uniref:YtxH domain-containing protein n=1 Tax=Mariniflexile sp. TaxID=1979402 RepID=UPI004047EC75
MKTSKTIIGVLGGVALGAAIGILFAPDKGKDTRKKIAKKSSEAKDQAINSFSDFLDTVSEKYNSLISKGEKLAKEGKKDIQNAKEDVKTVKEQMNK